MEKLKSVYLFPLFLGFTIIFFDEIVAPLNDWVAVVLKSILFIIALMVFEDRTNAYRNSQSPIKASK